MANEIELTLYVELENPDFPPVEGSETWRQFESKLSSGADIRVRIYDDGEKHRFIQTLKIRSNVKGLDVAKEYNSQVTEEFAGGFALSAESVQHKRRDTFKSTHVELALKRGENTEVHDGPELTIELDRFIKGPGKHSKWAKVDIEVQDLYKWIKENYGTDAVSGFHIELDKILPTKALRIISGKTEDPDEKQILSDLWDNEFKESIKM